MRHLIISGIRLYRRWVSPFFPGSCRFYPTCSMYAIEAVERKGTLQGCIMTIQRLLRCHPWHPGGYDPVSPVAKPECEELRTQGEDILENLLPGDMSTTCYDAPRITSPAPSKR